MHRRELQELARLRLREAHVLLRANEPSGAYYLSGYAVECALKACIARQFKRFEFPDKTIVNESYTHKLTTLVKVAGLSQALAQEESNDPAFHVNWALTKDWSESSRYALWSPAEARDLYSAISNRYHGVLRWTRQHW